MRDSRYAARTMRTPGKDYMQKKTLAALIFALIGVPFLIYSIVGDIRDYLALTDPALKTPHQFEEAFNEQMGIWGMSVDLDSVDYVRHADYTEKTVPVPCADGSEIMLKLLVVGVKKSAIIRRIEFEQPYSASVPAAYPALFKALLRIFETRLYETKDDSHQMSRSYREAVEDLYAFSNSDMEKMVIPVSERERVTDTLVLERKEGLPEEQKILSLRLNVNIEARRTW